MKTIFLLTGILSCAVMAGQTNYYTATKTFVEDGYIYQCDVKSHGLVTLYNTNNKFTGEFPKYVNTDKIYFPEYYIPLTKNDIATSEKRESIVNSILSASEKERVKGNILFISLYINPQTGKVFEVDFIFHKVNPFATIPVSAYRKIETELIKQIQYPTTDEGKKLNFIQRKWSYEVESTGTGSNSNDTTPKNSGTKITPVKELPLKEQPSLPVK